MKRRGLKTKYILRESMRGKLPDSILKRPKMGFPVPVGAWFRGEFNEFLEEHVLGERATARGIFEPVFVRQLVDEHQSKSANHSERLWSLVNFEIWMPQFIDGEGRHCALEN